MGNVFIASLRGIFDAIGLKCLGWYMNLRNVLKERKDAILTNQELILNMIEINLSTVNPKSWIIDSRCGSYLCTDINTLRNRKI